MLMSTQVTYAGFLVCLIFSGCGMAAVTPLTYSLLADYNSPQNLGKSIGWVGFSSVVGGLVGVVFPTAVRAHVAGSSSWRVVVFASAIAILVVGVIAFIGLKEPQRRFQK